MSPSLAKVVPESSMLRFPARVLLLPAMFLALGLARAPAAADEIVVRAGRVEREVLSVPAAVTVVDVDDIQLARPQLTLGESLATVPGVFTQNRNNFAQDLRISVRGFGARAAFGLRGVKLLVDGIPATLPDGQGQLDSLQLATAGRIEVMRGPSTSLYGSAAGGVIRVESMEPPEVPWVDARAGFGHWGYRSYEARAAGRAESVDYLVGLSHQRLDGYREHSRMESTVMNNRVRWAVTDQSRLTALLGFVVSPIARDPGGLRADEVEDDPRQASAFNVAMNAGESVDQVTGGLRFEHAWNERHESVAATYYSWRDFDARIPNTARGRIELGRFFGGGSLEHLYQRALFGRPNRLMAGFEVDAQRDDRVNRENLMGVDGALVKDQREEVTSLRFFVQDELEIWQDVELAFSIGYDDLRYRVDDHLAPAGSAGDSGRLDFDQWSPSGSLRWSPDPAANLYARVSTSFEPPTTTELAPNGGNGFNRDLEAQRAVNYEVGAKGRLPARFGYELAAYHIRLENELVPREDAGTVYFVNAGRSYRSGFELGLSHRPIEGLELELAYTYTFARYEEFASGDGVFDGNRVPGVPDHSLAAQVAWRHDIGFSAAFGLRYVGEFFADDANDVRTESYVVGDLRLAWAFELGRFVVTPHVGFDNLFDADYIDNVRLNAFAGRYFEPAPSFTAYGGMQLRYRFGGS